MLATIAGKWLSTSKFNNTMFYLLHGDDEFTCREQLKKLRQQGDFAYKRDIFNGGKVDLTTITVTCNTMPVLAHPLLIEADVLLQMSEVKTLERATSKDPSSPPRH